MFLPVRKLLKGLSIKQGRKFDDPASKAEIRKFIAFHQLDMSEVLRPVEEFKNFNEFFYRALKPEARPCSAPDNPHIIVSPADCRSVVFNRIDVATKIWIKGRDFSVKRAARGRIPRRRQAVRERRGARHLPAGPAGLPPLPHPGGWRDAEAEADFGRILHGQPHGHPLGARRVRRERPGRGAHRQRGARPVMVVCVGAMMVGSTVITRQEGRAGQAGRGARILQVRRQHHRGPVRGGEDEV